MSNFSDRRELAMDLIQATRDDDRNPRLVGVRLPGEEVIIGHLTGVAPAGFVVFESGEEKDYLNPDQIVGWCFADEEPEDA